MGKNAKGDRKRTTTADGVGRSAGETDKIQQEFSERFADNGEQTVRRQGGRDRNEGRLLQKFGRRRDGETVVANGNRDPTNERTVVRRRRGRRRQHRARRRRGLRDEKNGAKRGRRR